MLEELPLSILDAVDRIMHDSLAWGLGCFGYFSSFLHGDTPLISL